MKPKMMNMLEFKDALIDDLMDNGDMSEVIWKMKQVGKIDWGLYENCQRMIFQLRVGNTINDSQALFALSELLGAFTGRGCGLVEVGQI